MQPVKSAMGKWRRTSAGKLRLGCCCGLEGCLCLQCWIPYEEPAPTYSPKYLMLQFSGITLASCVYSPSTEYCRVNTLTGGSLNPTIVVAQQVDEGIGCCCWHADTGGTLQYLCSADPFQPLPSPSPVYAIVRKHPSTSPIRFVVMLGRANVVPIGYPYSTYHCGAVDFTWSTSPVPWDLFVGFIDLPSSPSRAFCEHPVTVDNINVNSTACHSGGFFQNAGYGGTCTVTPL